MMDVLLVNPPTRLKWKPNIEPLGLGYVAQSLLDEGHSLSVMDIEAHRWSKDEVEKRIKEYEYEVVCIGGIITTYKYTKWITPLLKNHNPSTKIIVGGGVGSTVPDILLKHTATDICVIGEGEITIKELIKALENSADLESVDGIWFKENGSVHKTHSRELIKDLDSVPFPNRDIFPIDIYLNNPLEPQDRKRSLTMSTARGCPYNCVFCNQDYGTNYMRLRSADSIIDEIKFLIEKYDVGHIYFCDNLFTVDKKRVHEFCDKLIDQQIDITWVCTGRVNLVDEELLKKMKSAGCVFISLGFESFSQKILNNFKKGTTVDQARRAIKMVRDAKIKLNAPLMIGMVGETKETVSETVDFCKDMGMAPTFNFTTPIPGTRLYTEIREKGMIPDEDAYVEQLDDVDKLTINLTDLSDEELIRLKVEGEKEMAQHNTLIKRILNCYYFYGFGGLFKRGIKKIYKT